MRAAYRCRRNLVIPPAALDASQPDPSAVLLSAEEAKKRMREIVERFFFRRLKTEDGETIRHLLVKSPPGLGKTTEAMEWATRYQTEYQSEQEAKSSILDVCMDDVTGAGIVAQIAIFVPRHELAREVKEVIERNRAALGEPLEVPVLRGRDHDGEKGGAP